MTDSTAGRAGTETELRTWTTHQITLPPDPEGSELGDLVAVVNPDAECDDLIMTWEQTEALFGRVGSMLAQRQRELADTDGGGG